MLLDVGDPRVFRSVFLILREVKQNIEAGEVLVAFDNGPDLLRLKSAEFVNRLQEFVLQSVLFAAKPNLRNPWY